MAGLYLIGPAMGMWSEELLILEEVNTGELTGKILFTEFTEKVDDGNSILFTGSGNESQKITIDIEQEPNQTNWVYTFKIENQGTIPVRLESKVTANDDDDDALAITCTLPEDVIGNKGLDPGASVEGKIEIDLKADVTPGTYTFHIDLKCIQWNAYYQGPDWWKDSLKICGTVKAGLTEDAAEVAEPGLNEGTPEVPKPELNEGKVKVTEPEPNEGTPETAKPELNEDTAKVAKPESTEGTAEDAESE